MKKFLFLMSLCALTLFANSAPIDLNLSQQQIAEATRLVTSMQTNAAKAATEATGFVSKTIDSVQAVTGRTVAKVDTGSLFRQVYEDFKTGTIAMARALKVGVDTLLDILIRQQIILGIIGIVKILIVLIMVFFSLKWVRNLPTKDQHDITEFGNVLLKVLLYPTAAAIVVILTFNVLPMALQQLLNPEYQVFLQIVEIVKGLKQ